MIVSHVMKMNIFMEMEVIRVLSDDDVFHFIMFSSCLGYRRGIPFIPMRCWGKNVVLVLENISMNWIFIHVLFIDKLVVSGIQKDIMDIMENTTPRDRM